MLILSRHIGQSIVIDINEKEPINVVVLGMRNNAIRLGIEAPKEINIYREELSNSPRNKNIDNSNKKIA